MDKTESLQKLVDYYGFSFKTADEITQLENAAEIIRYIETAYRKGRKDYADSWNYSGGY